MATAEKDMVMNPTETPTPTASPTLSPTATYTPTATFTPTPDLIFYSTLPSGHAFSVEYTMTAGDVLTSMLLVSIMVIVLFLIFIGLRAKKG